MANVPRWKLHLRRGLWELMVNLIYPAVLGTVLYIALDYANQSLAPAIIDAFRGRVGTLDLTAAAKLAIVVLTMAFYCCDYLYLRWTVQFRVRFFVYDVFFLVGLYLTVVYTHVSMTDPRRPAAAFIALLFLIFMIFYLRWDTVEYRSLVAERSALNDASKPGANTEMASATIDSRIRRLDAEVPLYSRVLFWEKLSAALLAGACIAALLWRKTLQGTWTVAFVLLVVTVWFVIIIWQKAVVHYEHPTSI